MCLSIFSFHYPPMHTFFNAVKGKQYLDRCKIFDDAHIYMSFVQQVQVFQVHVRQQPEEQRGQGSDTQSYAGRSKFRYPVLTM